MIQNILPGNLQVTTLVITICVNMPIGWIKKFQTLGPKIRELEQSGCALSCIPQDFRPQGRQLPTGHPRRKWNTDETRVPIILYTMEVIGKKYKRRESWINTNQNTHIHFSSSHYNLYTTIIQFQSLQHSICIPSSVYARVNVYKSNFGF